MSVRCPGCRSRRASFVSLLAHVKQSGHTLCKCGSYHYPHRPRSGCCEKNPMGLVRSAERADAPQYVVDELVNDYLRALANS